MQTSSTHSWDISSNTRLYCPFWCCVFAWAHTTSEVITVMQTVCLWYHYTTCVPNFHNLCTVVSCCHKTFILLIAICYFPSQLLSPTSLIITLAFLTLTLINPFHCSLRISSPPPHYLQQHQLSAYSNDHGIPVLNWQGIASSNIISNRWLRTDFWWTLPPDLKILAFYPIHPH